MNSKTRLSTHMFGVAALLVFSLAASTFAQEHPEHPQKAEHPEHPEDAKKADVSVTKEMMAKAIEGYIEKDSALKGGYFLVYDTKAKVPLALKLEKVHQDKLAMVSENLYFACTDLQATDGKTYDLDFFMKPSDSGLQVSEVMIHKEAGTPRYVWQEKGGVWTRK